MALTLTLPQLGEKASTKDYVITILGYDWPLSIKKIFNLIKKRYGHNVTYQAVFKAVNELVASGDVEKNLYYLQKHYVLSSKSKEVICVHHAHEWRPLFYLRAEYNWIRKLVGLGHKTYVLCAGNSLIDKWCSDFYKSIGCHIKLNVNCASTCELMVFGDMVIQVYLPSIIREEMEKEFSMIKELNRIDQKGLVESIFEKKTDIKVIINNDKDIAEQIRKESLRHF